MKNKINYSPEALQDLNDIGDYISLNLCNQQSAMKILTAILKDIDLLAVNPKLGAPLSSITELVSDYRFLISNKHIVFYRESNNNIFIDRILYSKRNYLSILLER
ncbi:MAG: type II toxin-antitoxin system RelE/ParE family toxin [Phascolarctobacterium sp.]|uniref:type II toxin-antitoxin system RelE/ParE family toxin n=1 Tax=Phascolarctobacterium sp. TaxID=2049039 RepID=UPI0026DC4DDB|nr:type II toxin-antitoxin system RelE/ParE family toxin [Phascolarctobacterium sp.]MDO4921393.1 type II toxin-antitoxin system RelE/ParE family toxin [Phascolarctobacterium sp.]